MYFILFFVQLVFNLTRSETCVYTLPNYDKMAFAKEFRHVEKLPVDIDTAPTAAIQNYVELLGRQKSLSIYNATHDLLVPLNYAATHNNLKLLKSFDNFFSDQILQTAINSAKYNDLERLHFAYLISEYIRLRFRATDLRLRNENYYHEIKRFILNQWTQVRGNNWSGETCVFVGKRSRVAYILTHDTYPKNKEYYGAITDGDLFTMAVGVNLADFELQSYGTVTPEIQEIAYYFIQTLRKKSFFNSFGGWELDRGLWMNHPDYLYAGNFKLSESTPISKVKNIGWDASHFSRMPAFLSSLSVILDPKSSSEIFIEKIRQGLINQFLNRVVVKTKSNSKPYLFKNYMNGSNGIYRYKYATTPLGYQPYENFEHIFYGWWSLLRSKKIGDVYKSIYKNLNSYKSLKSNNKGYIKEVMGICSASY